MHIAPGCGPEDYQLGKQFGSADRRAAGRRTALYVDGFGGSVGRHSQEVAEAIFDNLRDKGFSIAASTYPHRYPHCWRCGTELVYRLVDEWYISMGELYDAT